MTELSLKRLTREIQNFHLNKESLPNIFIDYAPDNLYKIRCMIIVGEKDTPYYMGHYFFTLNFHPKNYPFQPPSIEFETKNGNVRFHPNLYTNGKVCISILGTWTGPPWSSCQSLTTVLLSLQALFTEFPLQHEPGYENISKTDIRSETYDSIIQYENIKTTIIGYLEEKGIPPSFEVFLPMIKKNVHTHYTTIHDLLKTYQNKYPTIIPNMRCSIYHFHVNIDYSSLLKQFEELDTALWSVDDHSSSTLQAETPPPPPPPKTGTTTNYPDVKASTLEEGTTITYADQIFYVHKDVLGRKRWKKQGQLSSTL